MRRAMRLPNAKGASAVGWIPGNRSREGAARLGGLFLCAHKPRGTFPFVRQVQLGASMISPQPVQIAWATQEDASSLVPLLLALYRHDVPEAAEPAPETVALHAARLLAHGTPHRLAIAWSKDGQAVGLAAAAQFVSVSDPRPEHWVQMELKELFVLQEYRGARIGEALMAWIEAEAKAGGACRIGLARQGGQCARHRLLRAAWRCSRRKPAEHAENAPRHVNGGLRIDSGRRLLPGCL